jgi:hypothetical protein
MKNKLYAVAFKKNNEVLKIIKMDKGIFNMLCIFRFKKEAECFLLYLDKKLREDLKIIKICVI